MSEPALCTVRRTGTPSRPWEARCRLCDHEHIHIPPAVAVGAVAINTSGMGNRLWVLAMLAVETHLRYCHPSHPR